ncbi:MAG: serine/threonine protein kinase, partial [Deltaproteobacteria bacterium]|nr:serine/threonine protein kinase [Deltaproteobacteria bacterium]
MSERERRDGEGLLPSLGRYRLIRRLALGGMAEIYLARAEGAEGFAKPVVIKRILPDHAHDPENVALFVEEARLAARLNHANITQIFDFEEDERGGSYYMAMEYVHGQDLRALLDRCRLLDRRLGVARAVQICAEVLEGLSYAHEYTRRGRPLEIVHRDISPRNILVGFNGDVKLADFGIARARGGLEERGVVRGKVAYMSPEQIQDLPLDRRSDLYSLGLVLYEMLTGVRALEGPDGRPSTALTARAEFPPAEALCPELPGPLCAILRRALRRAPDERFADGRELLRELKGFLFGTVSSPAEIELREFM